MDIFKIIDGMINEVKDDDIEKWDQISHLSPEDMLRKKNLLAQGIERKREVKLLKAKIDLVLANLEVESSEWWAHVYKAYGLPQGNYHIADDGRIMREPEKKDK